MNIHIAEVTVDLSGRIVLDHLPFHPGEKVNILLRSHNGDLREGEDLTGSVLRYDNPFDPVDEDDWETRG